MYESLQLDCLNFVCFRFYYAFVPHYTAVLCNTARNLPVPVSSPRIIKIQMCTSGVLNIIQDNVRRQVIRNHGIVNAGQTGPRFNIKMTSYQYRKSHCGDKTILRPSYLHNGVSYTGKTTSLYWIGALVIVFHLEIFQLLAPGCPTTQSDHFFSQGIISLGVLNSTKFRSKPVHGGM